MANPQPCKVCETEGVHTNSDWIITATSDTGGFPPGTTFWVCQGCLAGLMFAWAQEQAGEQAAPEHQAEPEAQPEGPGVLEQIETDEGAQAVNGTGKRGRKSEPPPEGGGEVVEGSGQAETADVHE